ncbi:MAG: sigma-70 family RNA polymerase sigma factor [Cytophagales bacterium]|nr:sigma-70 family RNA polymerase sigma factor [Cytophagales bacterium]
MNSNKQIDKEILRYINKFFVRHYSLLKGSCIDILKVIDNNELKNIMFIEAKNLLKSYDSEKSIVGTYLYRYLHLKLARRLTKDYNIGLIKIPYTVSTNNKNITPEVKNILKGYVPMEIEGDNKKNILLEEIIPSQYHLLKDNDYKIDRIKLQKVIKRKLKYRPKRDVEMFCLHFFEGLDYTVIGKLYGTSRQYVNNNVHKSLKILQSKRKELQDWQMYI